MVGITKYSKYDLKYETILKHAKYSGRVQFGRDRERERQSQSMRK